MFSRSAYFLATLSFALLSASSTVAQNAVFVEKGEGVCTDAIGSQYDYLETTGIASVAGCQSRCTSLDATSLRGIEYEASSQGCLCLYENGAGFPANAFSEVGTDAGIGGVAGANSTFASFQCYTYSGGGSYSLVGTGGCVDASGEFYSYTIPFNVQGTQTAVTCENACTAAGTSGLVGLDYNGECYCLYSAESAPTVASITSVSSNSGSGPVAGASTFAGVTCQSFEISKYKNETRSCIESRKL
jgi:hypothetical protein